MKLVLSDEDIASFMDYGYAVVHGAFSKVVAERCRDIVWKDIESRSSIHRTDHMTWPSSGKFPMDISYSREVQPWCEVFSPRLLGAIKQICDDKTVNRSMPFNAGWWMITFPSDSNEHNPQDTDNDESLYNKQTSAEMNVSNRNENDGNQLTPSTSCANDNTGQWKVIGNWHIDGDNTPRYPYSKDVGVVLIMYFNDVHSNYGGTAVAEGSHTFAIQRLIEKGLKGSHNKLIRQEILESDEVFNIIELTGDAGDVIILHPLLLHARSTNLGPKTEDGVRFMCHPVIGMQSNLNFTKSFEELSVLERSFYETAMKSGSLSILQSINPQAVEAFNAERRSRKRKQDSK